MRFSISSSFSDSPCIMRPAGIPVQEEITSAISSAVTSSETMDSFLAVSSARCASSSSACFAGISPYSRRDASARLPSRCAASARERSSSIWVLMSPTRFRLAFSTSQRALRASSCSFLSAMSLRSASRRSTDAGSVSSASASSSMVRRSTARRNWSISSGAESISMRRRDAASSIRSIALSGS